MRWFHSVDRKKNSLGLIYQHIKFVRIIFINNNIDINHILAEFPKLLELNILI